MSPDQMVNDMPSSAGASRPCPSRHPNEFFETKIILIGCRFRPISGSIFFRSSGDGPSVDSLFGSNQPEISTKFRRNFAEISTKFRAEISSEPKFCLILTKFRRNFDEISSFARNSEVSILRPRSFFQVPRCHMAHAGGGRGFEGRDMAWHVSANRSNDMHETAQ